jgi:hypothetical protein
MGRQCYSHRRTCEGSLALDIRRWGPDHIAPDRFLRRPLVMNGEEAGSVGVRCEHDAVLLVIRIRQCDDDEGVIVKQRVPIAWTPCHFGGRRPWFVCTAFGGARGYCGRKVGVVYIRRNGLFMCRKCWDLVHATTRSSFYYYQRKLRAMA